MDDNILTIEKVYHTQAHDIGIIDFPLLATGHKQWLGDGFYFWQDYQFAECWGDVKKCGNWNSTDKYNIYIAELIFDKDDFIDTVFNEEDYHNFVKNIEKFAKIFQRKERKKPSLEEFNLFLSKFNIWGNIKVIRFQDVPENNSLIEVNGFYYKKRIQIRVNKSGIISNFDHYKTKNCL